jgi:putative heme-binding domain-containing protein
VKLDDAETIARGKAIFSTTCGIGYCHGKEGRAGRGPRLAGRKFDPEYLFQTISNGVGDSLMPAFQSRLSTVEIWSVVAYILALSGGPAPAAAPPASRPPNSGLKAEKDPNAGDPEAGRAIFFDSSHPKGCANCHRFQGKGADIAADLTPIASRPAREILREIVEPDARRAAEAVTVLTKSGERFTGLKKQENRDLIRLYDMASEPPVLRTIYKDQIESVTVEKRSLMPGDYGRLLTSRQLLDLVSFLKSTPLPRDALE